MEFFWPIVGIVLIILFRELLAVAAYLLFAGVGFIVASAITEAWPLLVGIVFGWLAAVAIQIGLIVWAIYDIIYIVELMTS